LFEFSLSFLKGCFFVGIMGVLASTLQSVFFARPAIANKKALPQHSIQIEELNWYQTTLSDDYFLN
jgi:hypothetical protein